MFELIQEWMDNYLLSKLFSQFGNSGLQSEIRNGYLSIIKHCIETEYTLSLGP
jgi:hypothetical protein